MAFPFDTEKTANYNFSYEQLVRGNIQIHRSITSDAIILCMIYTKPILCETRHDKCIIHKNA